MSEKIKALKEIKEEVAKEHGFEDWPHVMRNSVCRGLSIESLSKFTDEVAERYAAQFKPKWVKAETATDEQRNEFCNAQENRIVVIMENGDTKLGSDNYTVGKAKGWFILPEPPTE